MLSLIHIWFTLEYVERQETNLDGLRDWYKWNSDDGRFTVCCDDACDDSGRHAIHIFQTGDFKYRPEVYVRMDDDTGKIGNIVVRRGSDDGGLTSLEPVSYTHLFIIRLLLTPPGSTRKSSYRPACYENHENWTERLPA